MNSKLMRSAAFALVALSLPFTTACASDPDSGLQPEAAIYGKALQDAQKSQEKGAKLIAEGDKLALEGEKKVREGELMVLAGEKEVEAQKLAYTNAVRSFGAAATPKQVEAEVKILRQIAEKWDNGRDKIKHGQAMIKNGEDAIADGRAKKRKGEGRLQDGQLQSREIDSRIQPVDEPQR